MALDHSRLGLENKFLENKSGRIFCVRQVYLTKSCQQLWVRVNQHFILFIHHIWGETVIWGAVFIIQTSDKMQYFTIFQDKLHSFDIQDHRSTRGVLAKPFKKFPKSPIRPAGSHFWQNYCQIGSLHDLVTWSAFGKHENSSLLKNSVSTSWKSILKFSNLRIFSPVSQK